MKNKVFNLRLFGWFLFRFRSTNSGSPSAWHKIVQCEVNFGPLRIVGLSRSLNEGGYVWSEISNPNINFSENQKPI